VSISTGQGAARYWCDACKKSWCKHRRTCPSCGGHGFVYGPLARGHSTPNTEWLCIRCGTVVCVWCYWKHTASCFR